MPKPPKEQLWEYAKDANTSKLQELMQTGKAERGVTQFNLGEIFNYVEQNHDQARSMTALTAIGYLQSGKATNYIYGLHLSILTTLYLGAFQNDSQYNRQCLEFYQL